MLRSGRLQRFVPLYHALIRHPDLRIPPNAIQQARHQRCRRLHQGRERIALLGRCVVRHNVFRRKIVRRNTVCVICQAPGWIFAYQTHKCSHHTFPTKNREPDLTCHIGLLYVIRANRQFFIHIFCMSGTVELSRRRQLAYLFAFNLNIFTFHEPLICKKHDSQPVGFNDLFYSYHHALLRDIGL